MVKSIHTTFEQVTSTLPDYELIDSGDGQRLERFGDYTVVRPDPNILWSKSNPANSCWEKPSAQYHGKTQQGTWEIDPSLRDGWNIKVQEATFRLRPTPFRHLGIFIEQYTQWLWIQELVGKAVREGRQAKVLNLFAYTGAASILAAQAGAQVCHVDAAAGSVNWAKENARLSGLPEDSIRWIVDDVVKFINREVRRGNKYDLIIMDPPVFGRGPKGEIWRLEKDCAELATVSAALLSDDPLGLLVNFYATNLYPEAIFRVFSDFFQAALPDLTWGTVYIEENISKKRLPTGFCLRS